MSYVRSPFTICPQSTVTTVSSWKQNLSTSSATTQTDSFTSSDSGTQFPEVKSCHTETCTRAVNRSNQLDQVSMSPDLQDFLRKALSITEKEIQDSLIHHADWDAIRKLMPHGDEKAVLLHNIYPQHWQTSDGQTDQRSRWENDSGDFIVSTVEWNCNSSMLAVAFRSGKQHESWCSHDASLLFYSLYRTYDRNSIPSLTLQLPCITVLKSHPLMATVYAVGAHNGKVFLMDTKDCSSSKRNPVRGSSPDHPHHENAVSHLHWLPGEKGNEFNLVSLGSDGKIFMWNTNLLDVNDLTPYKAFAVSIQDLGKNLQADSGKNDPRSEVGITAAAFSLENEKLFVIGCCGGAVLLCSTDHKELAPSLKSTNEGDMSFKTPVQMGYAAHRSTIYSIDFSPSTRNLFVSASSDGEIRVYNSLDSKPVALIHQEIGPASACFWSRIRPVLYSLVMAGTVRSISLIRDGTHENRLCYGSSPFLVPDEEEVSNLWLNYSHRSGDEIALLSDRCELSIWQLAN